MREIEKYEVCQIFIDMINFLLPVSTVTPVVGDYLFESNNLNTFISLRDSVLKLRSVELEPTINAMGLINLSPKDVIMKLLSSGINISENFIKKILTLEKLSEDQAIQLASVYNFTYNCKGDSNCLQPRSINKVSMKDEDMDNSFIFSRHSSFHKAFLN